MSIGLALLALAAVAGAPEARLPESEASRAFVLFIDDLHLDFRSTPRSRAAMQRMVKAATPYGGLWSVVTTGTSSVAVPPTADLAAVSASVSRITGNSLAPSELVEASSVDEARRRALVSYTTAARAISAMASVPSHGPITVLYVSDGYDIRTVDLPRKVAEAAAAADATVIAISSRDIDPTTNGRVPPADWASYVTRTQESLRWLVASTRGELVPDRDSLAVLIERLWPPR